MCWVRFCQFRTVPCKLGCNISDLKAMDRADHEDLYCGFRTVSAATQHSIVIEQHPTSNQPASSTSTQLLSAAHSAPVVISNTQQTHQLTSTQHSALNCYQQHPASIQLLKARLHRLLAGAVEPRSTFRIGPHTKRPNVISAQ